MAKKLGEILLARNLISAAQLEEALQAQLVNGTRLGTSLVDMDMIKLDEVGRALSIQHGVPTVDSSLLEQINDSTLKHVPLNLVQKHVIVPFKLDDQGLHVAMRDPRRQIAGELSFTLKRSICLYVVPELRMMYLLEKYYGMKRDPRFLRLKETPRQQDERRTYMDHTVNTVASPKPEGWDDSHELVYLDQYDQSGGHGTPTHGTPAQSNSVVVALRQIDLVTAKLEEAHTGEGIAKLLVEPVLDNTSTSILFWVRGENAVGCWAHGLSAMEKLPRLVVPLSISSLLQMAFQKRRLIRSGVTKDQLHLKILQFLQLPEPGEVCIAPVILNEKVVNLLCLHSQSGVTFAPDALKDLQKLTAHGSKAYQRLVQKIKN